MTETMKVLVLDSAMCANPEALSAVNEALQLRLKVAVPDVLYVRELHASGGERLCRLGLRVEALAGIELAVTLYRAHSQLALTDAFALALAASNAWAVLSPVPRVQAIARELLVPVRHPDWFAAEIARRRSAVFDPFAALLTGRISYPSNAYPPCVRV